MQEVNRIRVRDLADLQTPIEALAKVVRSHKDLRPFPRRKHSAKLEQKSNLNQMKIDSYFQSFPKDFKVVTEVNVLPPTPVPSQSKLGASLKFLKTKTLRTVPTKSHKRPFGDVNGKFLPILYVLNFIMDISFCQQD